MAPRARYSAPRGDPRSAPNTLPRVRRPVLLLAGLVLLAGPTVLAFYSGGFFVGPRAAATAVAWALVLVLALAGPLPLPASTPGRVAAAGLAGLAAWSAVSLTWAPVVEAGFNNVQRLLLYLGVLLAATAAMRDERLARAAEPALAAGVVIVIGYGLAGRLLPGILDLHHSFVAGGRLEQPLTYWNAEGLLAAMGLLLCLRLAGDTTRPAAMRAAAAVASAPLGMGVYLSYSRGALVATFVGALFLLAAAPTRPQLRAALVCLAAGTVGALLAAPFGGVSSLSGALGDRERDGAIVLMGLLVIAGVVAVVFARMLREEERDEGRRARLAYADRLPAVAAAATALCVLGLVIGALGETAGHAGSSAGASASRLTSVSSLRYEYWRVGGRAFLDHPLKGVGSGGFRVLWRQERDVGASALEVHSLPLEMATELGLPGLLLMGLFLGGVAVAGRRALRAGAPIAPGACAVCGAWLLHASIDWDWQMPAVTLPALVLAGALLAASELGSAQSEPAADEHADHPQAVTRG